MILSNKLTDIAGDSVYNGSTPVIIYDAACGVPLKPPPPPPLGANGSQLGARTGDDVDRLEVARPSDPSDPYLRAWTKTLPGPIKFESGSPPCAFPSRCVFQSNSSLSLKRVLSLYTVSNNLCAFQ
jgi:hypothetical protein